MTTVTVWNEHLHEREREDVAAVYPSGIHGAVAGFLADAGFVALHSGKNSEPFKRLMGTS